jgi:hypothetical protein
MGFKIVLDFATIHHLPMGELIALEIQLIRKVAKMEIA